MKKIKELFKKTKSPNSEGDQEKPIAHNTYKGQILDYKVHVEESVYEESSSWQVHLKPPNERNEPHPCPFEITGHDYNGNGYFDRVFIRETSSNGYNAVLIFDNGIILWEPCEFDKNRIPPFTRKQILYAQYRLYEAMNSIRNIKYLSKNWKPKFEKSTIKES